MIKVNKLNKYFNRGKTNEVHAIDNTSLKFGNTGLVCILGESGSGKTTLLNTLGGIDTFQGGNITIDDTTLSKYSPKEMEKLRNSKFGYIFQEQYLLQDFTVAYNLRLALNMYDISEEEKEARMDYVLQAVDMKKYRKRLVSQLSGGQQQRIAIARALVKTPDIIFADEPTGNLDEANTMRIMSIIKKISKECLVILVTHEKRIADFFADRIIHIKDGRVITDVGHEGEEKFHFNDDTNLYLKEYEKETYQNESININLYSDTSTNLSEIKKSMMREGHPEITLNMVYKNGKLYIQTPDEANVVFLTSADETQMVDDKKPILDRKQIDEFEYSLSRIKTSKRPKLSLMEIYNLAKVNVKMLGKKQRFMTISFIITAILLVIAVENFMTVSAVDKRAFVTEDSHYIEVNAKRNSAANSEIYSQNFRDIHGAFMDSKIAEDIYIDVNVTLSFYYNSFRQISGGTELPKVSYVTVEHLKDEDLIFGRMPENRYEIVIDRWILDLFLSNEENIFDNFMSVEDFLNLTAWTEYYGPSLKIVGISDTDQPTVYIDKFMGISMVSWADEVASLTQLQAIFPGEYDNVALGADEVLVSDEKYSDMLTKGESRYTAKNGSKYKVAGTYPSGYDFTYVIGDSNYNEVLFNYICANKRYMIYTEEKEPVLDYFAQNRGNFDDTYVELVVSDNYTEQMTKYQADRAIQLNAYFIATVATFIISMFMLYFTMKSNAINRSQELAVYRLMGITRRSIIAAFALEVIMITNYTVLPVVLISSSIIKFIAIIPSLHLHIVFPWSVMFGLLAFLYAVNIFVGILPVYDVVKLPPARISDKV